MSENLKANLYSNLDSRRISSICMACFVAG